MGLGYAGTATAYDAYSIFLNPGALPWSKGIAINIKDSKNISAAEAYPTGYGASLGIGFLLNSSSNVPNAQNKNVNISGNAIILSAGAKLESILPFLGNFSKNFGVGISVKDLLSESLLQSGSIDISGNGWEVDCGMLYRFSSWLDFGLVGYNLMPYNQAGGGILKWDNATPEAIPAYYKFGLTAKIAGDIKTPFYWPNNSVSLSADLEMKKNSLSHIGLEWIAFEQYSLRFGLSQNERLNSIKSDFYFGAGLRYPDWQIDLSSGNEPLTGNNSIYLSVSYFPSGWLFIAKPIESVSLIDNMETYQSSIEVSGKARPEVELLLNGIQAAISPEGYFTAEIPLEVGENNIILESHYFGEIQTASYHVIRKKIPDFPAEIPSLADNMSVTAPDIKIVGKAYEEITGLFINGQSVYLDANRNFQHIVPLKMGKNLIKINGVGDGFTVSKTYTVIRRALTAEEIKQQKLQKTKEEQERKAEEKRLKQLQIEEEKQRKAEEKRLKQKQLEIERASKEAIRLQELEEKRERQAEEKRLKQEKLEEEKQRKAEEALVRRQQIEEERRRKAEAAQIRQQQIEEERQKKAEEAKLHPKKIVRKKLALTEKQKAELLAKQKQLKQQQEKIKQEKLKAEQERIKAEQERIKAEQARIKAEQEKIKQQKIEQARIKAEQERARLEKIRLEKIEKGKQALLEKQRKEEAKRLKEEKIKAQKIKEQIEKEQQRVAAIELKKKEREEAIIRKAAIEAEKIIKLTKLEQEKFAKLQALIKQYSNLTISSRVKMKMPNGYLSVYVLTDGRYIALKLASKDLVAIELYLSNIGKWSTVTYLPYKEVKDLI